MFNPRMVENFFKRTKFRRSRRHARSSIRSSLVKKNSTSGRNTPGASSALSSPSAAKRVAKSPRPVSDDVTDVEPRDKSTSISGAIHQDTMDVRRTSSAVSNGRHPNNAHQSSVTASGTVTSGWSISSAGSLPVLCKPDGSESTGLGGVVTSMRGEIETLRKELARSRDVIFKLQERDKHLRERLSEQAQRQLERGASKFEDISLGENRPTQLIKRYGNLYSEGRLDAMDALDELPEMTGADDLKVKLLLSIVVLAFRSAQKTLVETKSKIRELLHIPEVLQAGNVTACHLVQELEDTIAIYLRKTVEKHNISKNYEEVCDRVWETLYDYPSLRSCSGLLRYVSDCVSLAWALSLQNPPLVVDYESRRYDPDLHVRFHTSDSDSVDVKAVLWPVLTEGNSAACVYRGVVIT